MENLKVQIINKSKNLIPAYGTPGSAGMDLRCDLDEILILKPNERYAVPTGIYLSIPEGYEAQVRARSGLALKQGLTLANGVGTIDSDYRGEVKVILINLGNENCHLADGDRIAQLVFAKYEKIEFEVVGGIEDTERGIGGFGSTGIK